MQVGTLDVALCAPLAERLVIAALSCCEQPLSVYGILYAECSHALTTEHAETNSFLPSRMLPTALAAE